MIKPQSILSVAAIALFAFIASACNDEKPVAKIIVIDKKMPLIEWPDSVYVNSLDSILALEPIKKPKDGEKTTHLVLKSSKQFLHSDPISNGKGKKDNKKTVQTSQDAHNKSSVQGSEPTGKKKEAFSDKFVHAMSALQSDPGNSSLYKIVVANDEDISQLMRRTYGAGSLTLPQFLVRSSLQTVNPGINLDNLKAGDKVKVPRI